MTAKDKKPEWVPKEHNSAFTTRIMPGVDAPNQAAQPHSKTRSSESPEERIAALRNRDAVALARAITLIESNAAKHKDDARSLLKAALPHSGRSVRIGISGVPGAGKSTFIEAFGLYLIAKGHRIAVLAIDPSSTLSRGSILGDKTRMEELSRQKEAFIRPSPAAGSLGGVARKTRESIILCEAAGYDVILVETVGVGQNETTVRSMVDFFLLMQLPGGGDELQGIKKGVMEIADLVVVNKADGDNKALAERSRQEYAIALHYMNQATPGWQTDAVICSALQNEGIDHIWQKITDFTATTQQNGYFDQRRQDQGVEWMHQLIEEELKAQFYRHGDNAKAIDKAEKSIRQNNQLPTVAAEKLLQLYFSRGAG
jgi:LAO/AO transport system kinase